MKNYLIYVDASVDIDLNFAKEKGLNFIPMNYTYDNVEGIIRGDETDEELEQFYALIKAGKMPTTSQIAPFIYEELFTPLMEKGISILYIALSSGLSSTYQSALTASKTLKENFLYS